MKVVDAASIGVQGVTISSLRVGEWEKHIKFTVMPLNYFNLIPDMESFVTTVL